MGVRRNAVALTIDSRAQAGQRYWEVTDYAEAYRGGRVTPSQAMERVLAGVRKLAHFGAFLSVNEEDVRAQARASDARFAAGQPLSVFDGVPIAVKDMLDVKVRVPALRVLHRRVVCDVSHVAWGLGAGACDDFRHAPCRRRQARGARRRGRGTLPRDGCHHRRHHSHD